ncbi:hypothetical protein OC846_002562 [Tilletia horrida]|uniref:Uncharacterized protein n=1 Tax=Tilletia horrida TaxID=155126 RepID=A0AAN6JS07_9BASI|nr:hypothetical protein OC846_002562 [Tilletia horrida]KAK0567704.1 hypothetical protein OC861_002558 [Tilletia horrida]
MSLPFLVRVLDIPLSKLNAYQTLFDHHPELDRHVRFVRILDDLAVTMFRHCNWATSIQIYEPSDDEEDEVTGTVRRVPRFHPPSDDRLKETHRHWLQLKAFITRRWSGARFDITCGVSSVNGLSEALKRPNLKRNVVALRWIGDHVEPEDSDGEEERRRARYSKLWTKVAKVIQAVVKAQEGHDVKLATLQIEDRHDDTPLSHWIAECVWHAVEGIPSSHLHTWSVNVRSPCSNEPSESNVFSRDWSNMKRLVFNVGAEDEEFDVTTRIENEELEPDVDTWISAHPLLEHLDIRAWSTIPPLSLAYDFPNLTSIALQQCEPAPVGDFLLQHGHKLIELELPRCIRSGGLPAAIRPGLVMPNLRILRAPPRVAAALVDGQSVPQLAHIELKWTKGYRELMLEEWILPGSEVAYSITCLEIRLEDDELVTALQGLSSTSFNADRFPSLVELCLSSTYESSTLEGNFKAFGFSLNYLRIILELLEPLQSLRALRIEGSPFRPLASDEIHMRADRAPRRLGYITWHSPSFNYSEQLRVMFDPPQVSDETPREWLVMRRLPASFRAHISEEGEWIRSCKVWNNNTLFDHTVSPPRLPPQS